MNGIDQPGTHTAVKPHAVDIYTVIVRVRLYPEINGLATIDADIVTKSLYAGITPTIDVPLGGRVSG